MIKHFRYTIFSKIILLHSICLSHNDYICAEWADGPRAREGLGPSAHSAHTQFYDIGAFFSQKLVKRSALFEFPAFSRISEKKITTGNFYSKIIFGKPGKRSRA